MLDHEYWRLEDMGAQRGEATGPRASLAVQMFLTAIWNEMLKLLKIKLNQSSIKNHCS